MARIPTGVTWGHRLRQDLEISLKEVSLPDVFYISQSSESSTYEQEVETSKELHMHVAVNASVLNPEQKTQYPHVLEKFICNPWIHFSLEGGVVQFNGQIGSEMLGLAFRAPGE